MNEWWLISLLVLTTLSASVVFVYPLRQSLGINLILTPLFFCMLFSAYLFWGGFNQWQSAVAQEKSSMLAKKMLQSVKSPQELIDKLQAKLDSNPQSAKGWYLMGRLYSSQNEQHKAATAFAKAYALKPKNEQFAVHYAHSLWQLNQEQFNPQIVAIFASLLKNNPKQPDALAMLAMNAFLHHDYEDAIEYWQRLLELAPEQSEEATALRKAIAKAQKRLNLQISKF
jgi:cytochrome c-type biogenesis protein CcmH